MNINKTQNLSFSSLRGLGEPGNAEIFKNLSQKYGKKFFENADRAFQTISDLSGQRDVYIKFRTIDYRNQPPYLPEKVTDIMLFDRNGRKITQQCIDGSQGSSSNYIIADRFRRLVNGFRNNFKCDTSLESAINNTINKFA